MAAAARLNCLPRALRLASYQQNCFSRSLPLQPPASMPLMRLEGRAASRQLFANAVIAFPGKSSSPCSPYVAAFRGGRLRASALARRLSAFVVASNSAKQKKLTNNGEDDFTHDGGDHPDMPWPKNYQQTLSKSFTVTGIGLHTGAQVTVRVRPAYAGEGRYFVRVPEGTNSGRSQLTPIAYESFNQALEDEELTEEEEQRRTRLFMEYLEATDRIDEPYKGSFEDYVSNVAREPLFAVPDYDKAMEKEPEYEHEEILQRSEGPEDYIAADLDNATADFMFCTTLRSSNARFFTVEHLLSALEGCAVDNARIEVEGGEEMPIIDGSSLGWTIQIQVAGLRPAPQSPANPDPIVKMVLRPKSVVSVTDGDKFITLYPGEPLERLTYGIDFSYEAPVIGKQWFTWARREDEHYSIAVGSARTFAQSIEKVEEMRENGYIKGGTQDCALVADGENWLDNTLLRYPLDEPARHKMNDLIGDLSLLAKGGNQALPLGHIVAYKAGHSLHLKFAKALRAACDSPDDWEPALPWDLSIIMEAESQQQERQQEREG